MDSLRSTQEMAQLSQNLDNMKAHTSTEVKNQNENMGIVVKLETSDKIEIKDEPLSNVDEESMGEIKDKYMDPSIIILDHCYCKDS